MDLLLLGGTGWLGRAVAEDALRHGHRLTCVARGSDVPEGAALVHADRERDRALAPLTTTHWDAVIDVANEPGQVRRAVRDLSPVADRVVFVSSCSVYASQEELDAEEDTTTLEPLGPEVERMASLEDFGAAKVACERAVLGGVGRDRATILRPGLIAGPGDPSGRTGYWAHRFARPSNARGRVLVPDAPDLPVSVIDVRDLAAWCVHVVETGTVGVFNAVGDSLPFPDHIEVARRVGQQAGDPPVGSAPAGLAPPERELVLAPEEWLLAHGVAPWAGPRSLPLWLPDRAWYGMGARSNARARAAGLELRSVESTLADSLARDLRSGVPVARGAGLTDAEERELLVAL